MELFNLLTNKIAVFGQTFNVSLNWIGDFIQLLVSGVGVGVGIILFSLILKCIVLPFDVFQRISMRKQNVKMKEQQEKMEKLQKQYANNQELYNQKLMEMYKENGISMFSSCLPMILSMVIFFVAIGAFNTYAQYASVQSYNTLANAYNAKIEEFCPDLTAENVTFENGTIFVGKDAGTEVYYSLPQGDYTEESKTSAWDALKTYIENSSKKEYFAVNGDAAHYEGLAQDAVVEAYDKDVKTRTEFLWIENIWVTDASYKNPLLPFSEFESGLKSGGGCSGIFGSRNVFNVNGEKVMYGDLVEITGTTVYTESAYNHITAKLDAKKSAPNGYFILIALSIATILLQQFVSMRSQKEQQKYSTVDGQGASQQKMTLVIMTAMFAIFAFLYSAAFSIYMIVSNLFSLLSTLIINKCVDAYMNKKSTEATIVRMDNRRLSRIEAAKNAGKESARESRDKKSEKEDKKEE